jgi:hypothetical protein
MIAQHIAHEAVRPWHSVLFALASQMLMPRKDDVGVHCLRSRGRP